MPQLAVVPSRRLAATLADVRSQFRSFVSSFDAVATRRRELAPVFLRAWEQYHRETGRTFVAYVKELVPDLPVADKGYMADHRYHAALYLRRKALAPHTVYSPHRRVSAVTPFALLTNCVRSLFLLTHPKEEATWSAITRASHWHRRDLDRLLKAVRAAAPLPIHGLPRLVKRETREQVAASLEQLAVAADRGA